MKPRVARDKCQAFVVHLRQLDLANPLHVDTFQVQVDERVHQSNIMSGENVVTVFDGLAQHVVQHRVGKWRGVGTCCICCNNAIRLGARQRWTVHEHLQRGLLSSFVLYPIH